jgi:hypothetical protein
MVLSTGHTPPRTLNAGLRSPLASSSSSVSDSPPRQLSRRSRLADGLSQATFYPKRPWNPQPFVSPHAERSNSTRNAISHSPGRVSFDIPTPRPKSHSRVHPHVNVQPPTPSNTSSKFTKMAKRLAKDIENERERLQNRIEEDAVPTPSREKSRSKGNSALRSRFRLGAQFFLVFAAMGRKGIVKPSPKSRVYLPDVTGLTSVVESPARVRLDYHRVNPADREIQSKPFLPTSVYRALIRSLRTHHKYLEYRAIQVDLPRIRAQHFSPPCPGTRSGAGTV